jgi:hypothetical protein
MNISQRIILILAFLIILGMALFPPWVYVYNFFGKVQAERPGGYHFIFGQHVPQDQTQLAALFSLDTSTLGTISLGLQFYSMRLDGTRLFIQISATLLLMAILYFALRSKPSG